MYHCRLPIHVMNNIMHKIYSCGAKMMLAVFKFEPNYRKGFKNVSPRSTRDVKWPEMLDIWMDIKYYICKLLYV